MLLTRLAPFEMILASRSPRRQQLLAGLDFPFRVELREEMEEEFPSGLSPEEAGIYLSKLKARPFRPEIEGGRHIIITADTLVWTDQQLLTKPVDFNDGIEILRSLSGRMHRVITGVSIQAAHREVHFADETKVWFRDLSDEEIRYYLEKYQPFDKAGAYGAQEWIGYIAIHRIEGSYFNVMGLPIHRVYQELNQF